MTSDLDLLPVELRAQSRMEREIALPFPDVIEAVRVIEKQNLLILGWEAWRLIPTADLGPILAAALFISRSSLQLDPMSARRRSDTPPTRSGDDHRRGNHSLADAAN